MSTHITLVRHGTTEWMEKGINHGRLDSPLSDLGVWQVQNSAEKLRGKKYDAFYTSPLGRTMQTASIIASTIGQTPEPLDLLMERDFGKLEGTTHRHSSITWFLIRSFIEWFIPLDKSQETLKEVYTRAGQVLKLILAQDFDGSVLIISHFGVINMILRQITDQKFHFFRIQPASITEIEIGADGKGRIISVFEPGNS